MIALRFKQFCLLCNGVDLQLLSLLLQLSHNPVLLLPVHGGWGGVHVAVVRHELETSPSEVRLSEAVR